MTDVVRVLLPLARMIETKLERALRLPFGELRTQVMVAAWETALTYDGRVQANFYQYAFYTIKYKLIDQIRVEFGRTNGSNARIYDKVHTPIDPQDNLFMFAPTHEEGYRSIEVADQVRSILSRLPDVDRCLLEAYYFTELTLNEIAAHLGVTESRVCQLKTKALERARRVAEGDLAELAACAS